MLGEVNGSAAITYVPVPTGNVMPREYEVTPDGSTIVYVFNPVAPTSVVVTTGGDTNTSVSANDPPVGDYFRTPGISDDGRDVSFVSEGGDTGQDVHVRDLATGTLTSVSDGPGDASFAGTITPDGSTVILYGTLDGEHGVHAYDVAMGTAELVLPTLPGGATEIDGESSTPTVSADGHTVSFTSKATT